jgi:hypothetical protein
VLVPRGLQLLSIVMIERFRYSGAVKTINLER